MARIRAADLAGDRGVVEEFAEEVVELGHCGVNLSSCLLDGLDVFGADFPEGGREFQFVSHGLELAGGGPETLGFEVRVEGGVWGSGFRIAHTPIMRVRERPVYDKALGLIRPKLRVLAGTLSRRLHQLCSSRIQVNTFGQSRHRGDTEAPVTLLDYFGTI